MKFLLVLFSVLGLLASAAAANPAPADLGTDLSYLRVHSLADAAPDLRSAFSANRAFVLDLRYTTANEESLATLQAALALHPPGAPLFILLSPATPAAVAEVVRQTPGACLSLGITGTRAAGLEVKADAATDRQAYDALDAGTPVAALLSGKIEKDRFDEATLVQEFKNGNHDAEPPALSRIEGPALSPADGAPAANPAAIAPAPAPKKAAALTDHVLQRAVHLHQALLALKSRG